MTYLDDILLFSDSIENQWEQIQKRQNLQLKPSTDTILKKKTHYLEFRVNLTHLRERKRQKVGGYTNHKWDVL